MPAARGGELAHAQQPVNCAHRRTYVQVQVGVHPQRDSSRDRWDSLWLTADHNAGSAQWGGIEALEKATTSSLPNASSSKASFSAGSKAERSCHVLRSGRLSFADTAPTTRRFKVYAADHETGIAPSADPCGNGGVGISGLGQRDAAVRVEDWALITALGRKEGPVHTGVRPDDGLLGRQWRAPDFYELPDGSCRLRVPHPRARPDDARVGTQACTVRQEGGRHARRGRGRSVHRQCPQRKALVPGNSLRRVMAGAHGAHPGAVGLRREAARWALAAGAPPADFTNAGPCRTSWSAMHLRAMIASLSDGSSVLFLYRDRTIGILAHMRELQPVPRAAVAAASPPIHSAHVGELTPLGGAIDNADCPIGADILVELQRCVGNGATAAIMNSRIALPPPDPSVQGTRPDETGTVRDRQDLLTTAAVQRFLGAGGSDDEPKTLEEWQKSKGRDPDVLKKLRPFSSLNAQQLWDICDAVMKNVWVGPDDEVTLEQAWTAYQPGNLTEADFRYWKKCEDRGAEVRNVPWLHELRTNFAQKTRDRAETNLDKNAETIKNEAKRLGLGVDGSTPAPPSQENDELLSQQRLLAFEIKDAKDRINDLTHLNVGYNQKAEFGDSSRPGGAEPTTEVAPFKPGSPPKEGPHPGGQDADVRHRHGGAHSDQRPDQCRPQCQSSAVCLDGHWSRERWH